MRVRGEEGFPRYRVLDDIEHIGGVAPNVAPTRHAHLIAQLPPGSAAIFAVCRGVGGLQCGCDRILHGVMHMQSLTVAIHEREGVEAVVGVVRGSVRQHRAEERMRRAADDRGGVEDPAGERICNVGAVETGQFLDHAGNGDRFEAHPLSPSRRGQSQREWVAARKAIDPPRLIRVNAGMGEHREGVAIIECVEMDGALPTPASPAQ